MIIKNGDVTTVDLTQSELEKSIALLQERKEYCAGLTEDGVKETTDALSVAIEAMSAIWGYTWHECFEDDPESFPDDDRMVLCSFSNFSLPMIGRWETDEDGGGAWYQGDMRDDTFLADGLYVDGWWELPVKPAGEDGS